jgi:hypothetical protein
MITPDDMKEFERQFGNVKITELDSAMGAASEISDENEKLISSQKEMMDPLLAAVSEILLILQSIHETINR